MSTQSAATLKQRALRAGGWTLMGYGLGQVLRLASSLIMTRLLIPEYFGIIAIAIIVTTVLSVISDVGLDQKIIQSQRGNDAVFLDTVWVVQIVRGIAVWLVALLLSLGLHLANAAGLLPAQSVFASPLLAPVIAVNALSVLIMGFRSTRIAMAHRNFDQKRLTWIGLIAQGAALLLMIPIAMATRSIWTLVAGGLLVSLVTTVLSHLWLNGHPNRFRWEKNALGELAGFGKWMLISSSFGVLAINGDRLLLGAFADAHILGLYSIVVLILGSIQSGVGSLLTTVSLPALSEIARADPARLREVYYRLRLPADLLLLFFMGLLVAAGQWVIDLLYDPRYEQAGAMLQVMAVSLFLVRYQLANQVYLAIGKPRYLAIINVVQFFSLYLLVPTLYFQAGIQAAIWAIALHAVAIVPLVYGFNARLGLNDYRRELLVLPIIPVGWGVGSALTLLRW